LIDLASAAVMLSGRMCIGSRRVRLCELLRQPRGSRNRRGVAPRVVRLDDVDPGGELDHALWSKVCAMPIKRMRYVRQPTHLVDAVHRLLGGEERRNAVGDEETDDLAFQRLDLFPRD